MLFFLGAQVLFYSKRQSWGMVNMKLKEMNVRVMSVYDIADEALVLLISSKNANH